MRAIIQNAVITLLAIGTTGCATAVQRCLALPLSARVSEPALDSCRRASAEAPRRTELLQHYAQLLALRGAYEQLVELAQQATREHANPEMLFFLGVGLRKLGRCDQAIGHYRAYALSRPTDPDPYFGIGLCQEQAAHPASAIRAYRSYLKKERRPQRTEWRQRASARIAALRRPEKAATPVAAPRKPIAPKRKPPAEPDPSDCARQQRALTENPFDTAAYDRYAACAMHLARYREVIAHLRTALRDIPDYGRGWLHLARAQQAIGRVALARAAFKKACAAGVAAACEAPTKSAKRRSP